MARCKPPARVVYYPMAWVVARGDASAVKETEQTLHSMRMNVKSRTMAVWLGAAVAVAGLTGCHTGGRTAGTYIDDRMTAERVKSALGDAQVYKFPDVNVSSYNGTVQLNGFVASQAQKQEAAQIASQVQGVHQLVNNITVQPSETSPTGRTQGSAPIYNNNNNPPPPQQ